MTRLPIGTQRGHSEDERTEDHDGGAMPCTYHPVITAAGRFPW